MPSALILSRPGYPAMPRAGQPAHQRSVLPNPLVLGETLRKFPPPTADRDRPVSRRSEPSSRTAFIGEQPNPWDLLQPQDAMSRHRGAKPPRRYGRSGEISLLSPEATAFPSSTAGSLTPTFVSARHICLAVRHPSTFALLLPDCRPGRGYHGAPPLLFGRRPPQSNCPMSTVPVRATDR